MSRRLLYLFLLLFVAGALLFMRLPIVPTYAGRTIENAGHMPLFFLITFAVLFVLRDRPPFSSGHWHPSALYLVAGLVGVGLGVLSEVIQMPLRRDASWEDVFADSIGAAFALGLYTFFDRRIGMRRWPRALGALVIVVCATIYLSPIVSMTRAYLHRNGQFPVLADFRSPLELAWTVSIGVRREIVAGALRVDFVADEFPGLSFHEPVPDWSGYRTLVLDVENPEAEPLPLGLRVHDVGHGRQYSDRFNRHFNLAPGVRQQLRIALEDIGSGPKNRPMNMQRISDITLFRARNLGSRQLVLHGMRLE